MTTNIIVPALGESVVEATVARWLKKEGDQVAAGEALLELETDKVDLEVPADKSGTLLQIKRSEGEDVQIGDVLGVIDETQSVSEMSQSESKPSDAVAATEKEDEAPQQKDGSASATKNSEPVEATPVAKRMAEDKQIDLETVTGSGPGGRVTKEDVSNFVEHQQHLADSAANQPPDQSTTTLPPSATAGALGNQDQRREERIRMSRRRRTIAQRLVQAQHEAAILTTFNEFDMSAVIDIRRRRQDRFVEQHGIKLGFTSFFVKASIGALKAFPLLNAEIQDAEIVAKKYFDIGIAVGAEEGLVVPVLRDADQMSFAEIEQNVKEFVVKSQSGSLAVDDLIGGTFTITNGGVFGSLLSTPILNPPQVGILGLHKIEDRPMVVVNDTGDKEVAIRPMMYVALSYDHRIVDGREAVQFLVKVKQLIEDPEELLLAG